MATNRKCKDCPVDISDRGNRATRCGYCQRRHRDKYAKKCKKEHWQKNKDRYKHKCNKELGNPKQDDEILEFLRKKRDGRKV